VGASRDCVVAACQRPTVQQLPTFRFRAHDGRRRGEAIPALL
jgi:hypothetical protein